MQTHFVDHFLHPGNIAAESHCAYQIQIGWLERPVSERNRSDAIALTGR